MSKLIDLTGLQFGKLKVLKFDGYDIGSRALWLCECNCDKKTIKSIPSRYLRRGTATDCGCGTSEKVSKAIRKEFGESSKNYLIANYKINAKSKNLEFNLTNEEMINLFQGNCHYCGSPPMGIVSREKLYGYYTYSGIDRLNSDEGYITSNVVSCCKKCNFIKNKYSEEDFKSIIKNIYEHMHLENFNQDKLCQNCKAKCQFGLENHTCDRWE